MSSLYLHSNRKNTRLFIRIFNIRFELIIIRDCLLWNPPASDQFITAPCQI